MSFIDALVGRAVPSERLVHCGRPVGEFGAVARPRRRLALSRVGGETLKCNPTQSLAPRELSVDLVAGVAVIADEHACGRSGLELDLELDGAGGPLELDPAVGHRKDRWDACPSATRRGVRPRRLG